MASNIGKKPIQIEEGVQVKTEGKKVTVTGPKGTLDSTLPAGVEIVEAEKELRIKKVQNEVGEQFMGLARALVANMVIGVTRGFERKLELSGVGYRAKVEGDELVLNVGFAVPVKIKAPEGIKMNVEEGVITVSGISKQIVGDVASEIRKVRPPDPYKGKGIKYQDERLRKKVGKAAKAVGAGTGAK